MKRGKGRQSWPGLAWIAGLVVGFTLVAFWPSEVGAAARYALVYSSGKPLPPAVKVLTNEVGPDFPTKIVFRFKASAENDPHFKSLDLAFRAAGDVATTVRTQKLATGDPLQAEVTIDTRDEYTPPGTRFSYYWRLTDQDGQSYETPTQQFTYQDTRYPFRELKQGVLTIRWYEGSPAFGQQALDRATSTIDRLGRLYHVTPDQPINITIYPDSRTMFTALPPNTQEWVGGQAIPELGTIVLAIAPNDTVEVGRSIPHEVSHQVVYQATRNPYNTPPKWLDEGLAVNNQAQVDGFLNEAFQRGRANHSLFALRVLNGPFPTDSQQSFMAYGQSVQVVQYIIKKYGEAAIGKMLAAFKDGRSYDEIVQAGLGRTVDQLDREWKQSIGYPVPPLAPQPTVTALPTIPPTVVVTVAPTIAAPRTILPTAFPDATVALPTLPPVSPTLAVVVPGTPPPPVANVAPVSVATEEGWPVAGTVGFTLLVVVGVAVILRLGGAKRH